MMEKVERTRLTEIERKEVELKSRSNDETRSPLRAGNPVLQPLLLPPLLLPLLQTHFTRRCSALPQRPVSASHSPASRSCVKKSPSAGGLSQQPFTIKASNRHCNWR